MVVSSAQLPFPIHGRLCRRPDFHMGDSLRVCGLPCYTVAANDILLNWL